MVVLFSGQELLHMLGVLSPGLQVISFAAMERFGELGIRIMLMKFVGGQFYINPVSGNAQIIVMTAGDIKTVLAFIVPNFGRIRRHAGNHAVGGDYISYVEPFNDRMRIGGMDVMARIKASAYLGVSAVKINKRVRAECFNRVGAATAAHRQRCSGLRGDALAYGAFDFCG